MLKTKELSLLEETKQTGQLNAVWDPGLISGTEEGHWWKDR